MRKSRLPGLQKTQKVRLEADQKREKQAKSVVFGPFLRPFCAHFAANMYIFCVQIAVLWLASVFAAAGQSFRLSGLGLGRAG
jgi:hypothetical protein